MRGVAVMVEVGVDPHPAIGCAIVARQRGPQVCRCGAVDPEVALAAEGDRSLGPPDPNRGRASGWASVATASVGGSDHTLGEVGHGERRG